MGEGETKSEGNRSSFIPIMPIPFWNNTFTRFSEKHFGTGQRGACAGAEMDFQRCATRVGLQAQMEKCRKEGEDFYECMYHGKQIIRYKMMRRERLKQKKEPLPPPPFDAVTTNCPP